MLLPPSLEELIEANHPVRVVNQVVDRINIETFTGSLQAWRDISLPSQDAA